MADPREVPPTPGTEPRVGEGYQRPYREESATYGRHRESGTIPLTDGEIDARIMACAADLAATDVVEPYRAPFLEELVATFWHRVFRSPEVRNSELGASFEGPDVAQVQRVVANERRLRHERRLRELRSTHLRTDKPVTGVSLTRWWVLLFCVVPGIVIEVFGSAPSLDAAFDIGKELSWVFAAAISAILILAAEQLGNTLASSFAGSRRREAIVAIVLVTAAVGAGVWAVATLAESRATNLAYSQGSHLNISSSNSGGHFGAGGGETEAKSGATAATAAAGSAPSSPDYGFFVPLSLLIMFTAMLVAYRIEAAREWNELAEAVDETEELEDEARAAADSALSERQRTVATQNQSMLAVSAMIEREQGMLTLWLARFMAEYHRFCSNLMKRPQEVISPAPPETEDVLSRILRADPPGGVGGPGSGGSSGNGSNGSASGRGGSANGSGGSGNGSDPNGGRPDPQPESDPPFGQRPRGPQGRNDPDGKPRLFGR